MARFRVGMAVSLILDYEYVIQKKHWYGWSDWCRYDTAEEAIEDAKKLKKRGHKVEFYI